MQSLPATTLRNIHPAVCQDGGNICVQCTKCPVRRTEPEQESLQTSHLVWWLQSQVEVRKEVKLCCRLWVGNVASVSSSHMHPWEVLHVQTWNLRVYCDKILQILSSLMWLASETQIQLSPDSASGNKYKCKSQWLVHHRYFYIVVLSMLV